MKEKSNDSKIIDAEGCNHLFLDEKTRRFYT
jgi:hypothetical protein